MTQGNSQVTLLTVGKFAKVANTTTRTIRLYEKRGLIKPAKIDLYNKYRYYLPKQARIVAKIKLLQRYNYSLNEIRQLLENRYKQISLRDQLSSIKKEIDKKQREYEFLKKINLVLFENQNFGTNLKIQTVDSFHLFCFKVNKGDYKLIDDYINQIRGVAKKLGIKTSKSEITFYYEREFKPKGTEIEIALICDRKYKLKDLPTGFYFRTMPKVKCLVFTFQGPYNYLPLIYQTFYEYVNNAKIEVLDPAFEIYIENPLTKKSPLEYVTKIYLPLK